MPPRKSKTTQTGTKTFLDVNSLVKHINAKFGANTMVRASDSINLVPCRISTGSVALDILLSGGLAEGKVHQLRGNFSTTKTTTMHTTAKEFLAKYENACYVIIDAENATDEMFLHRILGFDEEMLSRTFIVKPDSGENTADIALEVCANAEKVIVGLDSVDAMTPTAELETEMGQASVSPGARMMNKFMRKLIPVMRSDLLSDSPRTTLIMLCQIREKVNTMGWGDNTCFHGSAKVLTTRGKMCIDDIVKNRKRVTVLSHEETADGEFVVVPRKVVGWYAHGKATQFYKIVAASPLMGNCQSQMLVTPNHWVFTDKGEKQVGDIDIEKDRLMVLAEKVLDQNSTQIAIATAFLGDGHCNGAHGNSDCTSMYLKLAHCGKQRDYLEWKMKMLPLGWNKVSVRDDGLVSVQSKPSADLVELRKHAYSEGGTRIITEALLSNVDLLGFAVWYMDDGSAGGWDKGNGAGQAYISCIKYSNREREMLADHIELLGVPRPNVQNKSGRLCWSGQNMIDMHSKIARYVPPFMQYKLCARHRGKYTPIRVKRTARRIYLPAVIKHCAPVPKQGSMQMYDLTVEGQASYCVDGALVHNTTWGGKGKEFAAATIIKFSRTAWLRAGNKQDGVTYGMRVQAELIKCKGPGHGEVTEYDYYKAKHDGNDPGTFGNADALVEWGLRLGVVKKAGKTLSYGKTTYSSQKEMVKALSKATLRSKLFNEIIDARSAMYLRG